MTLLPNTFVARCYTLSPFLFLWRKTDRIQWIPCVHFSCLTLCWDEKEKQLRSCSLIYRPRKNPKSSWNIPSYMKSIDINDMHYPYQMSRTQVSSVASPRYDFAAKHICRKMLQSASFCFLPRKTDWIQWIPCIHLLVWYYAETRKKSSLDHFCIKLFLELLTTNKPQRRSWNIP